MNPMAKTLLIVPCFNEQERLDFNQFNLFRDQVDFFFVDDGSTDLTYQKIIENNFSGLKLEKNLGKGHAIYEAFSHLKKTLNLNSYQWIGYWDADLSIPLKTVDQMISYLNLYKDQKVDAVWSSRVKRLGCNSKSLRFRPILTRLFSAFCSWTLKIPANDTQCGAKIFKTEVINKVFEKPFISRWVFDAETYLRLDQPQIVEFPLLEWVDKGDSNLSLLTDGFIMVWHVFKIKWSYSSLS